MAQGGTIAERITDLIGIQYSTEATYSGDLINAAINSIADMVAEDLLLKYSGNPGALTEASEWLVENRKVLKVIRVDANTNGIERECNYQKRAEFSEASDSTSLYYATKHSPVYTYDSNNAGAATLKILPVCNDGGQTGRIWYFPYVADSANSSGITQATVDSVLYLPNNLIHAIALKSSINILSAYISNQIQDEEDTELLQMVQAQLQGLEKPFQEEMARFMDESRRPGSE